MTKVDTKNNKLIEFLFYRRAGFLLLWIPVYISVNLLVFKKMMLVAMVVALILFIIFTIRLYLIRFNTMLLWTYMIILAIQYGIFFISISIDFEILNSFTINQSIENYFIWILGSYIMWVSIYSIIKLHPNFIKSTYDNTPIDK